MEPERWRRIEEIFLQAVELPAEERSVFLYGACDGDAELYREVKSLLASDRQARQGIEAAVDQAASSIADDFQRELSAYIGRRIGPYKIVREIGRGGMGAVYQAVRVDDQYLHSVAIKFVAQGMDTPESLARFRIERQILATLNHPNIASLLDGGATEDGRPYIVMEYIEGQPLLEYCKRQSLSVPDRLELFRSICGAVHHAHQMLVIHRDIKPGNVLVTADGVPKLLDFGIAKLLAPELVPGTTTPTLTVVRMLTPEYASPEQIRGRPLTTASDIYSLGVLLYELLSFSSPYKGTGRSPQEIERAVCDVEPRRLSEAVRYDARLRRQLAGDLETIAATALRKEPERRYGSALQLSEDIQRYLKGLPISARKDTLFYLAGKLVRRNRLASAAFALLALSVAAGWTATIREARRTERRFQEVRKLANSVLFEFHSKIQHLPGSTPAREMLVRTALDYLNNLSRESGDDPALEWEISQAYELVGDVQGDPAGSNLGKLPEALSSYRRAREIVARITRGRRDYEALSCLAWLHFKIGDLELRTEGVARAIDTYQRGLQAAAAIGAELHDPRSEELRRNGYQRLANARLRSASYGSALESARLAAEAADRWESQRPGAGASANVARSRLLLGNILWITGDLRQARRYSEEAVTILERLTAQHPESTAYLNELQEAYRRCGDLLANPSYFHFDQPQKAVEYHSKALNIAEQLVARDPNDAQALSALATTLRRIAAVQRATLPAEAVARYRRAIGIIETLMRGAPGDLTYMRDLANARLGLAVALRSMSQTIAALEEIGETLSLQRGMLEVHPDRSVVREDMFETLLTLGELRVDLGEARALENLNEALAAATGLVNSSPDNLYAQRCLAMVFTALGNYHARLARRGPPALRADHATRATDWYQKALAIWSQWRHRNLAMPFSASREKEVARLLEAPPYRRRAASLAK